MGDNSFLYYISTRRPSFKFAKCLARDTKPFTQQDYDAWVVRHNGYLNKTPGISWAPRHPDNAMNYFARTALAHYIGFWGVFIKEMSNPRKVWRQYNVWKTSPRFEPF